MKNNLKSSVFISFIIFLVICLAVVGYFGWNYYRQTEAANSSAVTDINKATVTFNSDDIDGSISAAADAAKQNPSSVDALLVLADSYAQKGSLDFQEKTYGDLAIATAQQAIALDPNNSEAYRILGYAYEIEQNYSLALTNYNKSIQIDPNNAGAYANRGHAQELLGNYAAALSDYNKALSINANLDQANLKLGELMAKQGSTTEATPYLNKVLTLDTNNRFKAEAENDLGVIALTNNDDKGALADFSNASLYDPTLSIVYVNSAEARLGLYQDVQSSDYAGLMKAVFQDLQKALNIDPNLTAAYITSAKASFLSGDKKSAMSFLIQAQNVVDNDISLDADLKASTKVEITNLMTLVK